jgi:hypothetical protein
MSTIDEAIGILQRLATNGKIGGRPLNIIDPAEMFGQRVSVHGHAPFMKALRQAGSGVPVMQVLGPNKRVVGSSLNNMRLTDAQVAFDNFERAKWLEEYRALRELRPDLSPAEAQRLVGKRRQVFLRGTLDDPSGMDPATLRKLSMGNLELGPVDQETGVALSGLPSFGDLYIGGTTPGVLYRPNEMVLDLIFRGQV